MFHTLFRALVTCTAILVAAAAVGAEEPPDKGAKLLSGTSIVGNDEAPKSLVIVPWKSSALGDTLDVSKALDEGRQPVDKEVFLRQLDYYQIRAGARRPPSSGAR